MARAAAVTDHTDATALQYENIRVDYVSQSDNVAQTIQSPITHTGVVTCDGGLSVTFGHIFKVGDVFSSNITAIKVGTVSIAPGPAGTTFPHNLTGTPTVTASPNSVQPYEHGVKVDATNITIYHNGGDAVTFFYIAIVTA